MGNSIPPLKSEEILHTESKDTANILNSQFQKAFSSTEDVTEKEFKDKCKMTGTYPTMPEINITENGVTKLLNNLNVHKAAGPDNITPRFERLSSEISPILTLIFKE